VLGFRQEKNSRRHDLCLGPVLLRFVASWVGQNPSSSGQAQNAQAYKEVYLGRRRWAWMGSRKGRTVNAHMFCRSPCSLSWKVMAESTVHWFVVREKHCSLAEEVQLIRQANMTSVRPTHFTHFPLPDYCSFTHFSHCSKKQKVVQHITLGQDRACSAWLSTSRRVHMCPPNAPP
jgi:hypothetical protein